jgi:DNA-binding MarR family transcriptional regulator
VKGLITDLNKAFDNKVRLGIMSVLLTKDEADFNQLKSLLEVTDGNLASHIKALEKEDYVEVSESNLLAKTQYDVPRDQRR